MTDGREPDSHETSDTRYGRREFLGRTGKVAAAAALAGSFAGVARATGVAGSHVAADELEVWYLTGSAQEIKYITSFTKRFGGRHSLDTTVTPYDYDPMNRALKLALSSKHGPDVAYGNPSPDDEFVYQKNNWVIDLNPLVKKYGWDKRFSPSVMNYWGDLCCDGNRPRSGIPFDLAAVGWYYNPKIFAKYGLKPPTTWAQLESLLAKLKAKGITPIAEGGLNIAEPGALHYVVQQIAHQTVPRSTIKAWQLRDPKASWTTPGFIRALTIAQDWTRKGYLNDDVLATSGSDASAMFLNGDAAMTVAGTWHTQEYLAGKHFNPRFFPTPRISKRRPWVMGGYSPNNVWMISAYADDQDTAAQYLDYMLGEQVARALWNQSDIPAFRFKKPPRPKSQVQADIYAAMQKTQTGFFLGNVGGFFITQYKPVLEKLFSLDSSPKDVAEELQENYKRTVNAG